MEYRILLGDKQLSVEGYIIRLKQVWEVNVWEIGAVISRYVHLVDIGVVDGISTLLHHSLKH